MRLGQGLGPLPSTELSLCKKLPVLAVGTSPFNFHSAFYAPDGLGEGAGSAGDLGTVICDLLIRLFVELTIGPLKGFDCAHPDIGIWNLESKMNKPEACPIGIQTAKPPRRDTNGKT